MGEVTPTLTLGPVTIDLTLLVMCVITIALVFSFVYFASRNMTLKPKGKQTVLEYLIDFISGVTDEHVEKQFRNQYSLFFFCLFLFVMVANNLGLMTKLETSHHMNLWTSPTANIGFDLSLSILISLICQFEGIRQRGVKAYIKRFFTPGIMSPMNILEEFTNIISLALRLYGNIFAGEVVTGLILKLIAANTLWFPVAFILNIVWTAFSIFISCIQAYVFTKLTSMYLGKKVNEEDE
ncbi:F0F1 ATP synthase subunit A [Streptococcus porcinus]|uniref:ATP synthase subunit a n=2 Tax=Streptococcus porcinus TaxID=1340 RepID=A0A4V0H9R2_STRPO|nr:F0F1 ATP synthase subunit A [Streptococcus porcinus]EGJ27956.1 ATP synthase F0, A subunit [Streptococcus porcinus str. Jelinkova 176]MBA2795053.1 F0F1 ATP synthase subunit A [Streptococcus porcinus]SQG44553.1 ATP synthase F0, A subunit [Streptococcus porcinus]VTT44537.1 ATP synthase F0, A subunit [Streptococcus porcinus]VTT45871.1 ATP synthase F0, A subunit [Streptococcus porcinus]